MVSSFFFNLACDTYIPLSLFKQGHTVIFFFLSMHKKGDTNKNKYQSTNIDLYSGSDSRAKYDIYPGVSDNSCTK